MLRSAAPWVVLLVLLAPAAPSLHLLGEHAHAAHEEGCPHEGSVAHWWGAPAGHEPVDCDPALHSLPLAVPAAEVAASETAVIARGPAEAAGVLASTTSDPGSPTRGPPRA